MVGIDLAEKNSAGVTIRNCIICGVWAIIDLGYTKKEIDITESIAKMAKKYNVKMIYTDGQIQIRMEGSNIPLKEDDT